MKDTGEDVYRQRFRVQITSLINAVPRFKDLERGQYHLTSWEVHRQITDEYALPVIEDSNKFDKITISVEFNANTSESLKNCDCF